MPEERPIEIPEPSRPGRQLPAQPGAGGEMAEIKAMLTEILTILRTVKLP